MENKFSGKIKRIIKKNQDFIYEIEYKENDEYKCILSVSYFKHYGTDKYKVKDDVDFILTDVGKAKLIDRDLVEIYNYDVKWYEILVFILIAIVTVFCFVFRQDIYSFVISYGLLIILIVVLIFVLLLMKILKRKNVVLIGKVVSKKIILPDSDTKYSRYRFIFEILNNGKKYIIKDERYDFTENLKIDDDVEIAVWKNNAIWANKLKKKIEFNSEGFMPMLMFILLFFLCSFFEEQIRSNYIYILPVLGLIILIFVSIFFIVKNNKKKK